MNKILEGDCLDTLKTLPDQSVHCCVTSPPYYGLRDYGHDGQIGLEQTPEEYVTKLVDVFREVRRVLRDDGTLWLNLGDSYNAAGRSGHGTRQGAKQGTNRASANGSDHTRPIVANLKPKDLIGIPWMVAFALRADGWYLRQDIIWHKRSPMPESVTDRCTKAHEYVFLFAKSEKYYYDHEAVKEPVERVQPPRRFGRKEYGEAQVTGGFQGARQVALKTGQGTETSAGNHFGRVFGGENTRNKRSVWSIAPQPYSGAHFATFPEALVTPCVLAGTSAHGVCGLCGSPFERDVLRVVGSSTDCPKTQASRQARGPVGSGTVGQSGGGRINGYSINRGWVATCTCGAPVQHSLVLDPFMGAGTTALVAVKNGRRYLGCELNPEYIKIAEKRIRKECGLLLMDFTEPQET